MLRRVSAVLTLIVCSIPALVLTAPHAAAKPQAKPAEKTKPAPSRAELEALEKRLQGSEADAIDALHSIAETNNTDAAPLVAALLVRGGTEKLI